MKPFLFVLLLIFSSLSFGQNDCSRDTSFYENGKIREIYDYDKINHSYCGVHMYFDSTGVKLSEGTYREVDSAACIGCYKLGYNKKDEKWSQYTVARVSWIPTGEWKHYHENGQLKEIGHYCEAIHEYTGSSYPLEWEGKTWPEPVAGYLTQDYLKDGVWECYDENGNHIKTEEYICGQLVNLTERY